MKHISSMLGKCSETPDILKITVKKGLLQHLGHSKKIKGMGREQEYAFQGTRGAVPQTAMKQCTINMRCIGNLEICFGFAFLHLGVRSCRTTPCLPQS